LLEKGGDVKRLWLPVLLFLIAVPPLAAFSALTLQDPMPPGHHHDMSMMNNEPADAAAEAKLLADKKESEFNHHLAGFFVALGGAFMLSQAGASRRGRLASYIWPASFLLSGVFVLVWSDTELWPFGPRHWLEALQNNREVLQHKVFAVLLLGLGVIELLRMNGTLQGI
jgi:hypothetical protein